MSRRWWGLAALFVAQVAVAAGSVKGTMTVNGKTFTLSHAYATTKPNPFDKTKTDAYVVLSDKELPAEAVHDSFAMMEAVDKVKPSALALEINEDHQINSSMIYSPAFKKMDQVSAAGNQKVEIKAWDATHIAGSVTVAKDDFFDEEFGYSVTFDVPLEAKPAPKALPGKPLPAGGGEPGKAFEAYRKAMAAGDLAAIKKLVSAENAKQMSSPEFKEMFDVIRAMQQKNIKITGGAVDGDSATLTAISLDEKNTTGTIAMVREGGAWKMAKESWRSSDE